MYAIMYGNLTHQRLLGKEKFLEGLKSPQIIEIYGRNTPVEKANF